MTLDENGQIILGKRVELKPYVPRTPKSFTLMTDAELQQYIGTVMIVDSEVYYNYYLILFKHCLTGKIVRFVIDKDTGEYLNERKLSWLLHNYTTVGFNSIKFDNPLMWLAYIDQDTTKIKDCANALANNTFPQVAATEFGFKIFNTNHVDLIEVCPLKGSLKLYGGRLHAPRIQDLPFDHLEEIAEWQKPIVDDYCLNDLDTTELLMNNLQEQLSLRHSLSQEYNIDCMSKSDAQVAEQVIGNELKRLTGKWPSKPKLDVHQTRFKFQIPSNMKFQTQYMRDVLNKIASVDLSLSIEGRLERPKEITDLKIHIGNCIYRMGIGGLHSSEETVAIKSNNEFELIDRDVASFYPRILLNLGLYPTHIGEQFTQVYNSIVERRLAAKKAKNLAISECLKITINGTFGKTGSPYSFLYAPQMTIQITVGGQLYLLMLIEALELAGFPVASANTDGIIIKCPRGQKEQMEKTIKLWEKQTGFETEETKYDAIYSRDVNAYLAIKRDKEGKIEFKGKNVYYDPWRGKSAKDQYWRFQKNPQAQICIEAIEELIANDVPIEKTIQNSKDITRFVIVKNVKSPGAHQDGNYLGKVIRWYWSKNNYKTINYIESNNKVPDSEGGKPCMDLPEEFPDDIDYDRYIKRTIGLLEDMAYLNKPQQSMFF
jgi:hypothetical protein